MIDKFNADEAKFLARIVQAGKSEIQVIQEKYKTLSDIHATNANQEQQIRLAELVLFGEFEAEKTRIADEEQQKRNELMQQQFVIAQNIMGAAQNFEMAIFDSKRARLDDELRNTKGMSAETIAAKEKEARTLFNNQRLANLSMIAINTATV